MAHLIPFDTLAYAKKLEARGIDVKLAEAQAEVLAEALETNFPTKQEFDSSINNVATEVKILRNDMNNEFSKVRTEMNAGFAEIRAEAVVLRSDMNTGFAELRTEISEVKSEVIKWVFGVSFAQSALIISALKFFH